MADAPTPTPTLDAQVKVFQDNNYQGALQQIRMLTCHCMLFVPGPQLTEEQKAYLHQQMMFVANLYRGKEGV